MKDTIQQDSTKELSKKEKRKAQSKAWYEANKDILNARERARRKDVYESNKDAIKAYVKAYRIQNREAINERLRKRNRIKCCTDPLYKFIKTLRSNSTRAFKRIGVNKPANTQAMLGCSWQEAKEHMEKLFQPGMTWANHGAWHIDHKVPIALATTMEEAIALNHISNLQPLWALDNISKGAKVQQ